MIRGMANRAELLALGFGIGVVLAWTAFIVPEHKNENCVDRVRPPSFARSRPHGFNAPSASELPAAPEPREARLGPLAHP